MKIEQYVMAYGVEHDRLRAILPDGFISPRPVLRINAEIREEKEGYAEFNIAVEKDGKTGWLNISCWNDIKFKKSGRITVFENENLNIAFTGVGIEGSCPAEKGSAGSSCRLKRLRGKKSSATAILSGVWKMEAPAAQVREKHFQRYRQR